MALAEEWGPSTARTASWRIGDSYLERVLVAPSTVQRVLAGHDVDLPAPAPRQQGGPRKPWPDWVEYRPRQVWGWDVDRHEALPNPAVMKGHRLRPVAAGRLKLRAV